MKAYIVVLLCICLFNSHVEATVEGLLIKKEVYGNNFTPLTDARSYLVELGLGFVKGLQVDPDMEESQCQTDILKLGHIYDDFQNLINRIKKKGFDFLEVLSFINATFRTLQDIEEDCHITGLFAQVWALRNPFSLILKIGEVIIKSYIIIPTLFRMTWNLVWLNDPRGVGFEIGFLMSTIFNYKIQIFQ